MRFFLSLPVLVIGLVSALPAPQEIDIDMVADTPDPTYTLAVGVTAQAVTYDATALAAQATEAVSSVEIDISDVASTSIKAKHKFKRAACAIQPAGATGAPTVSTDTPSAFVSNPGFSSAAAAAPTPSGYTNTFSNLNGSNNAYGYLGFTTLQTYDTNTCAQKCNKINGCMSFNIYFERDPKVDPGSGCENPASVTMIKCVFWGGPVSQSNAVNTGQWRSKFQVVIAGSNGYTNNTLIVPPGYSQPSVLSGNAINAPYDAQGYNTFMGSTIFNDGPFNASLCAGYCDAQTTYNVKNPASDGTPPKVCKYFNTYILTLKRSDGTTQVQGQYCSLYTESWPSKYATNSGQWRGTDQYIVSYSYGYSKTDAGIDPAKGDAKGAAYQAVADIQAVTLQPFCSSMLGFSMPVSAATAFVTITPLATSTTILISTVAAGNGKRALSTPDALTKYPASIVSSACGMLVSKASGASIVTAATSTVIVATQTVLVTAISTITAQPTSTSSSSTSSTTLASSSASSVSSASTASSAVPSTVPTSFRLRSPSGTYAQAIFGDQMSVQLADSVTASSFSLTSDGFVATVFFGQTLHLVMDKTSNPSTLSWASPDDIDGDQYTRPTCSMNSKGNLACSSSSSLDFQTCSEAKQPVLGTSVGTGCQSTDLAIEDFTAKVSGKAYTLQISSGPFSGKFAQVQTGESSKYGIQYSDDSSTSTFIVSSDGYLAYHDNSGNYYANLDLYSPPFELGFDTFAAIEGKTIDVLSCSASSGNRLSCSSKKTGNAVAFEDCPYLESGRLMVHDGSIGSFGDCSSFDFVLTQVS